MGSKPKAKVWYENGNESDRVGFTEMQDAIDFLRFMGEPSPITKPIRKYRRITKAHPEKVTAWKTLKRLEGGKRE